MKTIGAVLLMLALSGLYAWDTFTWSVNGVRFIAGWRTGYAVAHAAGGNTYVWLDIASPDCKTVNWQYTNYDLFGTWEKP